MTPAHRLASIVAGSKRPLHYRGRVMATWDENTGRSRVSPWMLSQRLRERGVVMSEADVLEALVVLAGEGLVKRGEGGWGVLDWDGLRDYGKTSPARLSGAASVGTARASTR